MGLAWPRWLEPNYFAAAIESNVSIKTAINGNVTTSQLPGWRWVYQMTFPGSSAIGVRRSEIEAFFASLEGQARRVDLYHFKRPIPGGSVRGTPTAGSASRGARQITINVGSGETLLPGDVIGIMTTSGMRRPMIVSAQTVGTVITAQIAGPLDAAVQAGAAVVWDHPTTEFILRSPYIAIPYGASVNPEFSVEFVEVWS